ncbi:tetratricopeptide repeat-containing sensor histidine kinase [Tenacibaculum sp. ZS6-P6]|uniref:tetratricopeptide repeat-containing sensor histidine kinase n=1 Tax=Tenacibaculum sp. ZS6-P6 TaxID=3447503 RepID=UPI003F99D5A1
MKLTVIYLTLFFISQQFSLHTQNRSAIRDSLDISLLKKLESNYTKIEVIDSFLQITNQIDKNIKNENHLIESYFFLAKKYKQNKEYLKSLISFNKAEEILAHNNSYKNKWSFYTNKGRLINELQEYRLARAIFKDAVQYLEPNQIYKIATSYLNISTTFDFEHHDSSAYYSKKAYTIFKDNPDYTSHFFASVNNIAYSYIKQGLYKKAATIINKNININNIDYKKTSEYFESYFFNTVGELHYKQKNYNSAIFYYKKSINTTRRINPTSHLLSLNDLASIYEIKKNYKEALKYRKIKEKFLLQFDKDNLKKEIAKLEYYKVLNKKNQLINSLEKKNESSSRQIQNTQKLAFSIGLLCLTCILILLIFYQKNRLKISLLNEDITLTRLKSLKSMMNPHFLFNSFNTLQGHILHKNELEASSHMRELSHLIRKILSNSESLYINFDDEIEIIKTYINLENKRFDKQFKLIITIDPILSLTNPKIPSMIIQPHIENAILHGLGSKKQNRLELTFSCDKNHIICIIQDNGVGRKTVNKKAHKHESHLSISTKNTNERIKLLKKIGHKETQLHIEDLFDSSQNPLGTKVTIKLPIIPST